jgi:glycerol-3-phosphate O-acyltransferase
MGRVLDYLLAGTHNHFIFQLPSRKGLVPWLLERIFTGILIDEQQPQELRNLPANAIVVYTIKHKSCFEYLFYHTRYRKLKLPVPELGFGFRLLLLQPVSRVFRALLAQTHWLLSRRQRLDPFKNGYCQEQLLGGRTAMLPLVEKHGFYRRFVKARFDPLKFLIELQNKTDRPIYLVPHLMFYSKNPPSHILTFRDLFLGSLQRPGLIRRLMILLRQPRKIFVEISQPLELRQFIDQPKILASSVEYQALMLRRQLLRQHNRHRQSITGPIIKSHEEMKESILGGERLAKHMAQHAQSRSEPLHAVRKQADGFLDEIAAKYNYSFLSFISRPVGWLINSMFDGTVLDRQGLQRVKTMSQKGPLILIPCHKSHIDYLLLSYQLFQNNMPCPHIAAGQNLSFWPLGTVFRAAGAFFLRRSFRGAVLYSRVFSEYIYKLLEEGFNIEIFIEGGRSRSGKLLMPKLGFLSILLNAFKSGACEDMIFVPVYIGYDQILEEGAYLHEIVGGKKEPENLSQIIKARRFLKQRFGKIYLNFHEPISLNSLLEDYDTNLAEMPQKTQNALCRELGWRVINAINRVSVVTPHALVAAAILNCPSKRFSGKDLFAILDIYLKLLSSQKAKLTDTLLLDHQRAFEQALESYLQRKIIELPDGEKGMPTEIAQYHLPPAQRLQLEYYKNNCIAYFVPVAFTALAILSKDAFQFSSADLHDRYDSLKGFFKHEFAFDADRGAASHVRKTLKAFIDEAILMPHRSLPETYQITSSGLRSLKLFARFLKPYFESYLVALQFFKQTPRNKARGKDRLKKMLGIGKTMLKQGEIDLTESLSKINFKNAISFFTSRKVKGAEDDEVIKEHEELIRNYLQLIQS